MTEQLSIAALKANEQYYENLAHNHGTKAMLAKEAALRYRHRALNVVLSEYSGDLTQETESGKAFEVGPFIFRRNERGVFTIEDKKPIAD